MKPADRDLLERAKLKSNPPSWKEWAKEQARWDESHIQPSIEYLKEGMAPDDVLERIDNDLTEWKQTWREQNADDLEGEYGIRTNAAIDQVWEVYKDEYMDLAERRMDHVDRFGKRYVERNPGNDPEERERAIEKYQAFHRYEPTKIGDFHKSFKIPKRMLCCGKAKWITYRSGKVDPATLKKPRRPVDYIHEFNAGVMMYLPEDCDFADQDLEVIDVPSEHRDVENLVMLGQNLGYDFELPDGGDCEAEARDPFPELYCTPDGSCLLVVQSKKEVLAMIWGGALGVYPRGIDG